MNQSQAKSAAARRQEIQAHAAAIGINDDYVALLVESFYGKVRQHRELGPIFDKAIGNKWDSHLARMKDFWASVAMNAGRYSGKPVPKHQQLTDVTPAHFDTWLALFRTTLEETAPTPAAIPYFMERAERIAQSLQLAMFGVPGIPLRPPRP